MAERCLRWLIMTSVIKGMQSVRVLTTADAAVDPPSITWVREQVQYILYINIVLWWNSTGAVWVIVLESSVTKVTTFPGLCGTVPHLIKNEHFLFQSDFIFIWWELTFQPVSFAVTLRVWQDIHWVYKTLGTPAPCLYHSEGEWARQKI